MAHRIWKTKEGRRARLLLWFVQFPFYGALFTAGMFTAAKIFGPKVAHELGDEAGVGIAEGMAKAKALVSGRWGA